MLQFIVLTLIFILLPGQAFSGTVKGTATYSAEAKPLASHKTGKFKKACGGDVPNEELLVKNQNLRNVVVYVEGEITGSKPGTYPIDQKNCRYEPHVSAMMKGSEISISSSDPINHNIHTYSFDNDPINIMFVPGQDNHEQEMEEPEVIKVECDLHGWMTAWIVATENSYFAVSDEDGAFKIPDLPAGKYVLTAWQEVLGSVSQKITVGDGDLTVNFDFSEVTPEISKK